MPDLAQWLIDHLVLGLLVLTRLGALLMAMPAVGVGVPRRIRLFLAVAVTALLLPVLDAHANTANLPTTSNLIELAIAVAREGLVGMLIGVTVQVIVTGLQLAGEAITSTGGMQLGDAIDPTTQSSMPALARLIGMLITSVMLIVGGHRLVLTVLLGTFTQIPVGQVELPESMLHLLLSTLGGAMAAGIRVAAPVIAALLLSNLVTGLISRTLPQINVLAIGLSINSLAMLVVCALSIGSAAYLFQDQLSEGIDRLTRIWEQPG
ncbi:MAG: flagellar biosynthetic protein FliR [Planctomycetota bacterium]